MTDPVAPAQTTGVDIEEREAFAVSGYVALVGVLVGLGLATWLGLLGGGALGDTDVSVPLIVLAAVIAVVALVLLSGLTINKPGETRVVTFFGSYLGTVRRTGLSMTYPLTGKSYLPVRVLNFETERLKVNERGGSPVDVSAIVVWRVADTAKARFAVDDYGAFVRTQSEAALRHVVASHPYDEEARRIVESVTDDERLSSAAEQKIEITLRGNAAQVSEELATEVAERVGIAGLQVLEVRLSNLAYAPEIAGAMLQVQQARAVINAREAVVEGAVTIVRKALADLESDMELELDPERRAAMTSNLLVVLVGGQGVQPVLNTGTIYS